MKALQKIIENIEAVFFDLDGTLVFTEELHDDSYKEVCAKLNISYETLKFPVSKEVYEEKKKIYLEKLIANEFSIREEIYEIYLEAIKNDKKVAIVTNTLKQNVDTIIKVFTKKPNLVLAGSDFCEKIKPDPDMYLAALKYFKLSPSSCLVIEDSPAGKTAGLTAGIRVYDVNEKVIYEPL